MRHLPLTCSVKYSSTQVATKLWDMFSTVTKHLYLPFNKGLSWYVVLRTWAPFSLSGLMCRRRWNFPRISFFQIDFFSQNLAATIDESDKCPIHYSSSDHVTSGDKNDVLIDILASPKVCTINHPNRHKEDLGDAEEVKGRSWCCRIVELKGYDLWDSWGSRS